MSLWQKYLPYNDNKKLLEDMDKILPKIRSRAIKRLCVLYKMIHGLMPFYVVECSEEWSRARKKGRLIDPETIIKWMKCSERTAYDYYYALEFMFKCEELCSNLDYYIKQAVRERLGMCTRVREVKEADE